jgi:hypothetical protein
MTAADRKTNVQPEVLRLQSYNNQVCHAVRTAKTDSLSGPCKVPEIPSGVGERYGLIKNRRLTFRTYC